jgi:hypothetical protein
VNLNLLNVFFRNTYWLVPHQRKELLWPQPLFKIRKSNYCKKGKFRVTSRILQNGVKFPHCDEKQGQLMRIFAHKVP